MQWGFSMVAIAPLVTWLLLRGARAGCERRGPTAAPSARAGTDPEVAPDAFVADGRDPGGGRDGRGQARASGSGRSSAATARRSGSARGATCRTGRVLHSDPDFPVTVGARRLGRPPGRGARLHRRGRLPGRHGGDACSTAPWSGGAHWSRPVRWCWRGRPCPPTRWSPACRPRSSGQVTDAERDRMRSGAASYVSPAAQRYRVGRAHERQTDDTATRRVARWPGSGCSRSACSWRRPFATMQLADLGARVVKVESPDGGEPVRAPGRSSTGESSPFLRLNRGKRSVALDLKSDDGKAAFLRPRRPRRRRWSRTSARARCAASGSASRT